MNTLLGALRRVVTARPGTVVATVLLVSIVFGYLSTLAQEADGGFTLSTGSEAAEASDRIADVFGDHAQGIASQVVVTADNVLDRDGIATAIELREAIAANPTIGEVVAAGPDGNPAITTWADLVLGSAASDDIDPLTLDEVAIAERHRASLAALEPEQAAQFAKLLSADTDAGLVIVQLDPAGSSAALSAAQLAFGDLRTSGTAVLHPFNPELIDAESEAAVASQMGTLLLLAMGLIVLILVAINRNVIDVVSSLLGLVLSIVWLNGIGALLGPGFLGITDGMGQMAMAIPILLVGLGVDYGIHLSSRYREERQAGTPATEAAGNAIGAVGTALVLATITTVVGFLTNLANPLAPLRDFGLLAAVGVVSAFLIMTTLVPSARLLVERRHERRHGSARVQHARTSHGPGLLSRVTGAIAPVAATRSVVVLIVAAALTLGAGIAATGLSTAFSQTEFLPSDSQALETITLLSEEFGGDLAESTRVLIEGDVSAQEATIDAFILALADNPDVRTTEGAAEATVTVSPAGDAALVTISTMAGEAVDRLESDLRDDATGLEAAGLDVRLTSDNLLITAVMNDLRDSQVAGLLLTLFGSMLILAGAFWARRRAPMLGVLAIATVGLVTIWVLGVMALTGIPFNMMTAMISALAIGIGVPFGIHVVNRFLEERDRSVDGAPASTVEALARTLAQTGGALVGSAATTMAGFGVLALSSIGPMRQFGIVTAMTIGFALLASLVVLPAMLAIWDRTTTRRGRVASSSSELDRDLEHDPVTVS